LSARRWSFSSAGANYPQRFLLGQLHEFRVARDGGRSTLGIGKSSIDQAPFRSEPVADGLSASIL
jgi:hypothetical protein